MSASYRYIGVLFKSTWRNIRNRYWFYLAFVIVGIVITILLMPHDRELLNTLRMNPVMHPGVHDFAGKISYYSMYTFTPLMLCFLIWITGWNLNKKTLKKAALVCFVAATVAGILVNVLRPGFGRPRPRAGLEDKFYYVEFQSDMLSYPSGHVMSNIAGATALTILEPWIGVPYLILSGASGWSRMQRNAHYPSDVIAGTLFGVAVGIAFAQGARLMKREEDPLEKE
jgi:membrane-associated phospholipid phosphatase